jgi:hypothetical protein
MFSTLEQYTRGEKSSEPLSWDREGAYAFSYVRYCFDQLLSYLADGSMPPILTQIVQIAMSLRDTTTDENELAMRYTILRSECAEVGARLGATSLLQI